MGKQVYCDICNCYIASGSLLEGHKQGKKHKRLVSKKESKEKSLECSIYVRGFKKSATIEKELETIFQKYGSIHGLYLDKSTLSYAIIQFENKETVHQVLSSSEDLYINGKRLVIKERTKEGSVSSQKPCPKSCEDSLGNSQSSSQSDQLVEALMEEDTLTDQMRRLVKETALNAEEIKLRELICQLLSEVFIELYADTSVHLFGSSACGIGIKGSDVDATIITSDLANYSHQGPHSLVNSISFTGRSGNCLSQSEYTTFSSVSNKEEKPRASEKEVVIDHADGDSDLNRNISNSLHSNCPPLGNDCVPFTLHSSESADKKHTLFAASAATNVDEEINTVTNVLRKFAPGCKNIFALKTAHCPLIGFIHKDSGLKVDLSINNRLALQNTMLIKRYTELDQRVKPLIFTVRAWARSKGLYGKGAKQLTGYSLTLLVLHFLQHCEPPVLPCLQESDTGDVSSNVILGWQCFYSQNLLWKSSNEESEGALLVAFFKYFVDYDFDNQTVVISSLCRVSKNSLTANWRTQDLKSFKLTAVCLQDPFELTHNVAHNMSSAGLDRFKEELVKAYSNSSQCLAHCTGNDDISTDCTTPKGLPNLLEVQLEPAHNKRDRRKRLAVKYIFDIKATTQVTCLSCAQAASEILEVDLRMQCERTRNMKASDMVEEEVKQGGDHPPPLQSFSDKMKSITPSIEATRQSTDKAAVDGLFVTSEGTRDLWRTQAKRAKLDQTLDCGSPTVQFMSENGDFEKASTVKTKSSSEMIYDSLSLSHEEGDFCDVTDTGDYFKGTSKSILRSNDPSFLTQGSATKNNKDIESSSPVVTVSHGYSPEWLYSANKESSRDIDAIEIFAKAWANTWVKRRQQRRLLLGQAFVAGQQHSIHDQDGSSEQSIDLSESSVKDSCSGLSVSSSQSGGEGKSSDATQCTDNGQDRWTSGGPVLSVSVKIVNLEHRHAEYSTRVIVKLLVARDLNIFHTFYAFFKKRLLCKLNLKGDAVLSSMKR